MKLTGLQVLNIARNAVRDTSFRSGRVLSLFPSQAFQVEHDKPVQLEIKSILQVNGSDSLTSKIDDKLTRRYLKSERAVKRKLENASSKYKASLEYLARFIDTLKYPIPDKEMTKILYPALSVLPTEIESSEKLLRLGKMYLEVQCQAYIMQLPSRNTNELVSNFDYGRFQDGTCESLYEPSLLNRFLKENGLVDSIILDCDAHESTRNDQAVNALYRIIGTIAILHGPRRASEFIDQQVIGGMNGLMRFRIDR